MGWTCWGLCMKSKSLSLSLSLPLCVCVCVDGLECEIQYGLDLLGPVCEK